jgi:hypothetical protein
MCRLLFCLECLYNSLLKDRNAEILEYFSVPNSTQTQTSRGQFDLDFTALHFRQGDLPTRFDSKKYSYYLQIKRSTVNAGVAAAAERFD